MRWLAMLSALLVISCTPRVYSPPSGGIALETSAVTQGAQRVGLDASLGGAMFGPDILTLRGSAAFGLSDSVELSAAPSVIWVRGSHPGDSHPGIYAARAGLKYAPARHFALTTGLGGGGSAAGAFVSPDVGLVGAFENRFFVPFVSVRALASLPVAARAVRFSTGDDAGDGHEDMDDARDVYRLTPRLTVGLQASIGARLPLTYDVDAARIPSLSCAWGFTTLHDFRDKALTYGAVSCGVAVEY